MKQPGNNNIEDNINFDIDKNKECNQDHYGLMVGFDQEKIEDRSIGCDHLSNSFHKLSCSYVHIQIVDLYQLQNKSLTPALM